MRKLFVSFLLLVLSVFVLQAFAANKKPVMVVTPFLTNVTVAPNSTADIEIVVQNNSTVNQTITDIKPLIPPVSLVTADLLSSNCGFLSPGQNCAFVLRLNSIDQLGDENLNVSVCSFNGTMCSRIKQPVTVQNAQLTDVFVFPTNPTIANGSQQQFTAVGLYADERIQDITTSATWSSSDTSKATISNASSSEGLATSVAVGATTIAASLDDVTGSTTLTVGSATLTSIVVLPVNRTIPNGTSQQYFAVGIYSDNTFQNITNQVVWTSSDTSKATIVASGVKAGLATAVATGATTITATKGAVSGNTALTISPAVLVSIGVTPSNARAPKGTTRQYTATGVYSDNSSKNLTTEVTWSTANAQIAIASNQPGNQGSVLAVENGSTTVIATLGSIAGSTAIRVTNPILSSIDVSPTNETIGVGEQQQYTATGIFTDNSTRDITNTVTWRSSNNGVATISKAPGSRGLATGVAVGSTTISARRAGITGSTTLTVDAATLTSIAVTPANPSLPVGTDQQFIATGTYSDTTTRDLTSLATWLSSNPTVASVQTIGGNKGLASTYAAGSATISAGFEGVTGNTLVTVTAATLTSIAVTPANSSMPVGTDEQMIATGTYSDLSTKDVTTEATWSSSNTSAATISNADGSQGVATGVAAGATNIDATLDSVTGTTGLTVTKIKIGDDLDGGVVACLEGGDNDLIAAKADNSAGLTWGGVGTITNAQSDVDGAANTATIVSVLGAGTGYAAGLCDAYEIDSAGNTPCVGGNTCYNDWFLPSTNQIECVRKNRNQVGGFDKVFYWSSTEYSVIPNFSAWFITFANSGHPPAAGNKADPHAVRCVRLIDSTP